jgi:branched-chain amino acid transport system ATP-binding protein
VASDVICRRGIGFVPEDRRIFPGLTVEENLVLGFMQCPSRSGAESKRRLDEIYQRFPRLGERRQQMGTTLSGGEQQMLAMARVLVGKPKLLLIDEPTEGLAPRIVEEIFHIMEGLRRDGIPIVLVEQNVRRAIDLSTRFYALERGQVLLEGDASNPAHRQALFERIAV